eukprot:scaffold3600_cov171-Amphora_coffeaeformis.AAC.15
MKCQACDEEKEVAAHCSGVCATCWIMEYCQAHADLRAPICPICNVPILHPDRVLALIHHAWAVENLKRAVFEGITAGHAMEDAISALATLNQVAAPQNLSSEQLTSLIEEANRRQVENPEIRRLILQKLQQEPDTD